MKDTVSSLVTFVLMLALLYVLWIAFAVGQTRYLTIDEFQWGHASWLVSQGEVPYRDFYEHHLPLGYVLHSVFLNGDGSFIDKTLLLRTIAFAYLLAAAAMLGSATWVTRRDLNESLLAALLPIGIGFGLMSAIEYRGDNWSAVGLLVCAGLVEMARESKQPRLSLAAGVLFSIAVLMTQKILVLGGGVLLLMLVAGFVRRRGGRRGGRWEVSGAAGESRWTPRARSLAVPYPFHFCLGAGLVVLAGLAWAGWLGILGDAFEINVSQAIEHERLYPGFDFRQYIDPFLASAPISSALLVLLAVAYLASVTAPFWIALLLAAALGGASVTAPSSGSRAVASGSCPLMSGATCSPTTYASTRICACSASVFPTAPTTRRWSNRSMWCAPANITSRCIRGARPIRWPDASRPGARIS
jgi:hypothetical protein